MCLNTSFDEDTSSTSIFWQDIHYASQKAKLTGNFQRYIYIYNIIKPNEFKKIQASFKLQQKTTHPLEKNETKNIIMNHYLHHLHQISPLTRAYLFTRFPTHDAP